MDIKAFLKQKERIGFTIFKLNKEKYIANAYWNVEIIEYSK